MRSKSFKLFQLIAILASVPMSSSASESFASSSTLFIAPELAVIDDDEGVKSSSRSAGLSRKRDLVQISEEERSIRPNFSGVRRRRRIRSPLVN